MLDAGGMHPGVRDRQGRRLEEVAFVGQSIVDAELATPKSTDPTVLDAAVTISASNGDTALYEKYLARSQAAVDPQDRYRFLYGLTSFPDPALIRRTEQRS